jgi:O-antigen ligase
VSRPVRAAAASTVPLLALALQLSASRASWLALGAGLAATAWLHRAPSLPARTAAIVALPAAVAVAIGHFSRLGTADVPRIGRPVVTLVAIGCAAIAGAAAARGEPKPRATPSRRTRSVILAGVVAVGLLAVVAVASTGVTEPRSLYYHVAWREYLAHPLLGSGAGTFGRYWLLWGQVAQWGGALDAHSLYLETLAELGPIGLCLLAVFFLYPLRRVGSHRMLPFVPAATGAVVAFYVHAGLDWDWELPAVVVAVLACSAVVAFAEQQRTTVAEARALPGAARAAALAAAVLTGVSAIAGARSTAEPSAAQPIEAPQSGASSPTMPA